MHSKQQQTTQNQKPEDVLIPMLDGENDAVKKLFKTVIMNYLSVPLEPVSSRQSQADLQKLILEMTEKNMPNGKNEEEAE